MTTPTPADRLALAVCFAYDQGGGQCKAPCGSCRTNAKLVTDELAQILRERDGGSSGVADWLDGVGCHPTTTTEDRG